MPADPEPLWVEVNAWYLRHGRDLPWRTPTASAWEVLVSEIMLQQTPVARVEPVWREWLERWPTPAHLAAASPGDVVRAWGRLGYPRRALRLREAAVAITAEHGGDVPRTEAELLTLPGIGVYTAAAVACFAHGERTVVIDTNVRRVLARAVGGVALPAPSLDRADRERATAQVPADRADAAVWNVAVMELGALVCTARAPRCGDCPIEHRCAWVAAGRPVYEGPAHRGQAWAGTDRQCRGTLLTVLRETPDPVSDADLTRAWTRDEQQRLRCLDSLVADGLVEPLADGRFALPSGS